MKKSIKIQITILYLAEVTEGYSFSRTSPRQMSRSVSLKDNLPSSGCVGVYSAGGDPLLPPRTKNGVNFYYNKNLKNLTTVSYSSPYTEPNINGPDPT